jgi:hypothetical protein
MEVKLNVLVKGVDSRDKPKNWWVLERLVVPKITGDSPCNPSNWTLANPGRLLPPPNQSHRQFAKRVACAPGGGWTTIFIPTGATTFQMNCVRPSHDTYTGGMMVLEKAFGSTRESEIKPGAGVPPSSW